ncbi:MBL fold metallo-hydrolase [uncultured Phascolarctobacterium sp.]|uniref:MBL fold metallo-hydrolase n=1 Tax=uncultured Phascolarctobacterium sp. TaxID=512296 RepID=UPI0025D1DB77|nr:MBL fold metallo-hydrolase [uncultured Phascolarctobacterium sp.]
MKLVILADNNTYIDQYYLAEPALSIYIENGEKKYLFDTGYSNVYLKNAAKLGIDLEHLDAVIISHGHNDHTGGLAFYPKLQKKPLLVAHLGIMESKRAEGLSISLPVSESYLQERFTFKLIRELLWLDEQLVFLGEIPRVNDFENKNPVGEHCLADGWHDDYVLDDSALVYKQKDGIYIITGCSHAGICNIAEYAKQVTGCSVIKSIIGGLHLFSGNSQQTLATVDYLKQNIEGVIYPCHCTNLAAKFALHKELTVQEVGVGLTLEW